MSAWVISRHRSSRKMSARCQKRTARIEECRGASLRCVPVD